MKWKLVPNCVDDDVRMCNQYSSSLKSLYYLAYTLIRSGICDSVTIYGSHTEDEIDEIDEIDEGENDEIF